MMNTLSITLAIASLAFSAAGQDAFDDAAQTTGADDRSSHSFFTDKAYHDQSSTLKPPNLRHPEARSLKRITGLCYGTSGFYDSVAVTIWPSTLWSFDVDDPNPAATKEEIGRVLVHGRIPVTINSLSQHPKTGILYATTSRVSKYHNHLLAINKSTGKAKVVGPTFSSGFERISAIDFDSEGQLYGWTAHWDRLYTIDTSTGNATLLYDFSNSILDSWRFGMSFSDKTGDKVLHFLDGHDRSYNTINLMSLTSTENGVVSGYDSSHGDIKPGTLSFYAPVHDNHHDPNDDPADGTVFIHDLTSIGDPPTTISTGIQNLFTLAFNVVKNSIQVSIDIKFCRSPNTFSCNRRKDVLSMIVFGTDALPVRDINVATAKLCLWDHPNTCVSAANNELRKIKIKDRGTPYTDLGASSCRFRNKDGYDDLELKWERSAVIDTLLHTYCGVKGSAPTLVFKAKTNNGVNIYSEPVHDRGIDQIVIKKTKKTKKSKKPSN